VPFLKLRRAAYVDETLKYAAFNFHIRLVIIDAYWWEYVSTGRGILPVLDREERG
jgi:hypothetical protein